MTDKQKLEILKLLEELLEEMGGCWYGDFDRFVEVIQKRIKYYENLGVKYERNNFC